MLVKVLGLKGANSPECFIAKLTVNGGWISMLNQNIPQYSDSSSPGSLLEW